MLTVAMLSLAANLVLTGVFIRIVKRLLRTRGGESAEAARGPESPERPVEGGATKRHTTALVEPARVA